MKIRIHKRKQNAYWRSVDSYLLTIFGTLLKSNERYESLTTIAYKTSLPTHALVAACQSLVENENITDDDITKIIQAHGRRRGKFPLRLGP